MELRTVQRERFIKQPQRGDKVKVYLNKKEFTYGKVKELSFVLRYKTIYEDLKKEKEFLRFFLNENDNIKQQDNCIYIMQKESNKNLKKTLKENLKITFPNFKKIKTTQIDDCMQYCIIFVTTKYKAPKLRQIAILESMKKAPKNIDFYFEKNKVELHGKPIIYTD